MTLSPWDVPVEHAPPQLHASSTCTEHEYPRYLSVLPAFSHSSACLRSGWKHWWDSMVSIVCAPLQVTDAGTERLHHPLRKITLHAFEGWMAVTGCSSQFLGTIRYLHAAMSGFR